MVFHSPRLFFDYLHLSSSWSLALSSLVCGPTINIFKYIYLYFLSSKCHQCTLTHAPATQNQIIVLVCVWFCLSLIFVEFTKSRHQQTNNLGRFCMIVFQKLRKLPNIWQFEPYCKCMTTLAFVCRRGEYLCLLYAQIFVEKNKTTEKIILTEYRM